MRSQWISRIGKWTGSQGLVMSTTYDSPAAKNLVLPCLRAENDCNTAGRLPFKCFLKFEILALSIHPSIENLLCEKHAENVLMEPHVWSDIVYIRLTQFENNAIWQKRQVDEMSVVSFFWHYSWVGRIQAWESRELASISGCYWHPVWFRTRDVASTPHSLQSRTWGERALGFVMRFSILVFHQIRRLSNVQGKCATAHLPSGQAVKRAFHQD